MTTGKKISEETKMKIQKKNLENKTEKDLKKEKLVKKIKNETKEQLLPAIQTKMKDVVNYVVDILREEKILSSNQIMSILARKSLNEMAMGMYQVSYTPTEIAIAFNIYLDMIDKINQITNFPPTIHSFTTLLGITPQTFYNWLSDPEKKEIASYIKAYFIGAINTATLTKQVETIAGIYTTKTMGLIEEQQPIVIEHKKETNIDKINAQLNALKKDGKIIDAEFEEKDFENSEKDFGGEKDYD